MRKELRITFIYLILCLLSYVIPIVIYSYVIWDFNLEYWDMSKWDYVYRIGYLLLCLFIVPILMQMYRLTKNM